MLDLLLVNPGNSARMYQDLASPLRSIEPPWWAGLIASFIREHGYETAILDADADNLNPEETAEQIARYDPILAAIVVQGCNPSASSTPKMTATRDVLIALKDRVTMLTGLHPSSLPERTLREEKTDFVCQGEGFYTILELLAKLKEGIDPIGIPGLWYLKDGELVWSERAKLLPADELPPVAWDLLDMSKYRAPNWPCLENPDQRSPHAVIYTSLGCPYNCHFCQVKQLYSGKPSIRFRNPEQVIKEIDLLVNKYGVRHIKVADELFTINEKQVASICDPIIQRGYDLNMWQYCRIDRVTRPMLEKMKQAGMHWAGYGIEAGSEEVRRGIDKKFSQDMIRSVVEMTREAGMSIMANFIFGLPEDDLESMQSTLDMMSEYNFEYVNLYCTMAYPGSQLYEDALRQGVRLPETWDGYAQLAYETLPLPTKYLSSEEVLAFRDRAFHEYFSRPEYLEMVKGKFGDKAVEHIKGMLKYELKRKNKKIVASIIITSLRPERLEECLQSIDQYTAGIDYEVILVSPFDVKPHPNVVHIRETEPGGTVKATALGYQYVKGEYVITMSDDSRVTAYWLENMIAFMRPHDNEMFEGGFKHMDSSGNTSRPRYYGKPFATLPCIRKDKADELIGFFDYPYYQNGFGDPDLSLRVYRAGGTVGICPDAKISVLENDPDDLVNKENRRKYYERDRAAFKKRWG